MSGEKVGRSLRLLILAEDFYPKISGGAHARFRFCELSVQRGHDVVVFTPQREGAAKQESKNGVDIKRPFPSKPPSIPAYASLAILTRILYSILLFVYLLWWLRGREFDGIHSASHSMHWVGKLLSIVYRFPLVTFIGYTPSANGEFRLRLNFLRERLNFRLFMGSRVFCRSSRVASIVRDSSRSDVDVIHGILNEPQVREAMADLDTDNVRQRFEIEPDDAYLVFVGRIVPIKNPIGALRVMAQLPDEYSLAMIGDGPLKSDAQEYAKKKGLEDHIYIAGELSHTDTLRAIAAAECLVLPSKEEAYPTAVFEALALGCGVVATPVGVLPEIDHERLNINDISEFPSEIKAAVDSGGTYLDEETLEQYSMKRYANSILSAFQSESSPESESGEGQKV